MHKFALTKDNQNPLKAFYFTANFYLIFFENFNSNIIQILTLENNPKFNPNSNLNPNLDSRKSKWKTRRGILLILVLLSKLKISGEQ